MYMGVIPERMSMYYIYLVRPKKGIKSFDWSYRWLSATVRVLGMEPRPPGREITAPNH